MPMYIPTATEGLQRNGLSGNLGFSLSLVRGQVRAQVKGQAPLAPALQHSGHSRALYIVVLISAHISVYIGMNLSVYIGIHRYIRYICNSSVG